ncbi:hypothetical protein GCM10011403_29170 [Pseudohongiella nitratireducens]|uniref:Uncharacterized protein n=1 Tax=Pseudohongiella nitratireducens TaxID=1768907 RepID=A0A916VJZ8_9GAMM|nr:hypothetical protein [Pseudohongiella nitratireducens]MDF1624203.1 hypothetical protein [Pseudohongiella nitratireducens]GFZ83759.1 hypothetical protein GCM10011403_29170 [Pseudohongiella nitratireducens]
MLDIYGYLTSWGVYLVAGTLCYILFYKATGKIPYKWLANPLRGIMLAVTFTPWYVAADSDLMAPALMVIALDMITLGGDAFIRAAVPLVLAIGLGIVLSLIWTIFRARAKRN